MENTLQLPPHAKTKYNFAEMKAGESFDVDPEKRSSVISAYGQYVNKIIKEKKKDKVKKADWGLPKFSVRTLPDGSVKCYRIK